MTQPLKDILVLDFSTLPPGPMATLMLSEAGAEVIRFEPLPSAADCYCSVVKSPAKAATDPHLTARGVLDRKLNIAGQEVPELSLPIAPKLRAFADSVGRAASLDKDNARYGADSSEAE
tara:strand:- start:131 stop:487 length:357 start_codon:yes stop_codon:yes gene_type:complete